MALKVYAYKGCDTCRRALKWLEARGIEHRVVAIREQPPTTAELKRMLKHMGGDLRKLFNTAGRDYRDLNMKEKLPTLSETQVLDLLHGNGNLVKRPFAVSKTCGAVGFKEAVWEELFR